MRLHHANVRTVNPVAMVQFYRTLGFSLVGCVDLGGPRTLYLGDPDGGAVLELTVRAEADAEWLGHPGTGHIAVEVGDLDAEVARLDAAGIATDVGPMHPGGRDDVYVAFVRDPDGNRVELVQHPFPQVRDALPAGLTWEA